MVPEQRQVRSSGSRNVSLAVVVVFLSISVALSGWIIISALDKLYGDPFEEERTYDLEGTMAIDGTAVVCYGTVTSHYSSESSLYRVFTYHASYSSGDVSRNAKFSIMFDSDKCPLADMYTHLGTEGDYDLWSGSDHGADVIFYLDKDSIVCRMDIDISDDHLKAVEKVNTTQQS